jgi:hypothetical protein
VETSLLRRWAANDGQLIGATDDAGRSKTDNVSIIGIEHDSLKTVRVGEPTKAVAESTDGRIYVGERTSVVLSDGALLGVEDYWRYTASEILRVDSGGRLLRASSHFPSDPPLPSITAHLSLHSSSGR